MKDTRERLLKSGCEVFAEKGFHDANVADICERAEANIAAINYYFGGKQKLYEEVLTYAAAAAEQEYPLLAGESQAPTPEDRLAWFIRGQFVRSCSEGLASCFDRLVVHEMTNPSPSHALFFEKLMRPRREYLLRTIRELLPAGASDGHVRVCAHNIVSLFAFNHFRRLHRDHPKRKKLPPPEVMAHHATVFALGGIHAIAQLPAVEHPTCHATDHREEKH